MGQGKESPAVEFDRDASNPGASRVFFLYRCKPEVLRSLS